MKVRLVKNWRKALGWFSINIPAVNMALLGSWLALPSKLQDAIPIPLLIFVAIVLLVLGMIGRLIDQGGDNDEASSQAAESGTVNDRIE